MSTRPTLRAPIMLRSLLSALCLQAVMLEVYGVWQPPQSVDSTLVANNYEQFLAAWKDAMYSFDSLSKQESSNFSLIVNIIYTPGLVELEETLVFGGSGSGQVEFADGQGNFLRIQCKGTATAFYIGNTNQTNILGASISGCSDTAIVVEDKSYRPLDTQAVGLAIKTFNLGNSELVGNTGSLGGAVRVLRGQLAASVVNFTANKAQNGGAIYVGPQGVANNLYKCNFSDNGGLDSSSNGSAVVVESGACLRTVEACIFQGSTGVRGAAIDIREVVDHCSWWQPTEREWSTRLSDSVFVNNTALDAGGAVYVRQLHPSKGPITISSCNFTNNSAGTAGGALWGSAAYEVWSYNTSYVRNFAAIAGGAIFFTSPGLGRLVVNDTETENFVEGFGSSVLIGNSVALTEQSLAAFELSGSPWELSTTYGSGGAIAATGEVVVSVFNTTMSNNVAALLGGGLVCVRCIDVSLHDSRFVGNMAGRAGGGVALTAPGGQVQIVGVAFEGNVALGASLSVTVPVNDVRLEALPCGAGGGGGLCLQTLSRLTLVEDSVFVDNNASIGGAIFLDQSVCSKAGLQCNVVTSNISMEDNPAGPQDPDAAFYWAGPDVTLTETASPDTLPCNLSIARWLRTWPTVVRVENTTAVNNSINSNQPFNITTALRDLCGRSVSVVDRRMAVSLAAPLDELALTSSPTLLAAGSPSAGAVAADAPPGGATPLPLAVLNNVSLFGRQGQYRLQVQLSADGEVLATATDLGLTIRNCTVGEVGVVPNMLCQSCTEGNANTSYSFNPQNKSCDPCPLSTIASCALALVLPMDNYWQSSPRSPQLHPCLLPGACKYGSGNSSRFYALNQSQVDFRTAFPYTFETYNNTPQEASFNDSLEAYVQLQCSPGYTGNACGCCEVGYGRLRFRCQQCGSLAASWAKYLVLRLMDLLLISALLFLKIRRQLRSNSMGLGSKVAPNETLPSADQRRAHQMQIELDYKARMNAQDAKDNKEGVENGVVVDDVKPAPDAGNSKAAAQAAAKASGTTAAPECDDLFEQAPPGREGSGDEVAVPKQPLLQQQGSGRSDSMASRTSVSMQRSVPPSRVGSAVGASAAVPPPSAALDLLARGRHMRMQAPPSSYAESDLSSLDSDGEDGAGGTGAAGGGSGVRHNASGERVGFAFTGPQAGDQAASVPRQHGGAGRSGAGGWSVLFHQSTRSKIDGGAMFEALVFYLQMLGLLARMGINYPEFTEAFLSFVDVTSSVTAWTPLDCIIGGGGQHPYARLLVAVLIPLITQAVFGIFWTIYFYTHLRQRMPAGSFKRWFVGRSVVTASQICLFYYSSVTANALSLFSCVTLDRDEPPYTTNLLAVGRWWVLDTETPCLQGTHLTWALALGIPTILLFSVGTPVAITLFCVANRGRLHSLRFRERFGMLYENYHVKLYWWGLVQYGRLLVLNVAAECFQYFGAAIQVVSFMAILTFAVTVHMAYWPFRRAVVNFVHAVPMYAVLATMYMALSFIDGSTSQAFRTTMAILIIVLNVLCILLIVLHVIWAAWPTVMKGMHHTREITDTLRRRDPQSLRQALAALFRRNSSLPLGDPAKRQQGEDVTDM